MKNILEWFLITKFTSILPALIVPALIMPVLALSTMASAEEASLSQSTHDLSNISITTGEWPPFLSQKLKYNGVAARIIDESFALQDITVKYGWFPWKRAYSNMQNGSWDASAIWAITPERSKDLLFSDPVIEAKTVFFFHKDSFKNWTTFEDLSGLIIGATDGYFNGKEFEQAEKDGLITIERTTVESHNFKKLAAHRLDAVIAEVDTGYDIIHNLLTPKQRESIKVSTKMVSSFLNHLVISKQSENAEQLISSFNKGLKELTENGKVEQYLKESRNGLYHQTDEIKAYP
ncbi:MAG: ABC transporter substrate-binding protein [Oleispira sp.]